MTPHPLFDMRQPLEEEEEALPPELLPGEVAERMEEVEMAERGREDGELEEEEEKVKESREEEPDVRKKEQNCDIFSVLLFCVKNCSRMVLNHQSTAKNNSRIKN